MGKRVNGKYEPDKKFLLAQKANLVVSIVVMGLLFGGLAYLSFKYLGGVGAIIGILLIIFFIKSVQVNKKLYEHRYNCELHGTWGSSSNPYDYGTPEYKSYEQLEKLNENLDELNRKIK